jgi:hypothetical protein
MARTQSIANIAPAHTPDADSMAYLNARIAHLIPRIDGMATVRQFHPTGIVP